MSKSSTKSKSKELNQSSSGDKPMTGQEWKPTKDAERHIPVEDLRRLAYHGYEFGKEIGEGAHGSVIDCSFIGHLKLPKELQILLGNYDLMERVPLACKVIKAPPFKKERERISFMYKDEVKLMHMARHDNIIAIHSAENFFNLETAVNLPAYGLIFMEMADGDLRTIIMYKGKGVRGLPEPEAKEWFRQIMNAVEYLHSIGITHRDIKPDNVLYKKIGDDQFVAKLTDFSCAHLALDANTYTTVDKARGTLRYMAPEVIQTFNAPRFKNVGIPKRSYDPKKADIYACGATLTVIFCGFGNTEMIIEGQPILKELKKEYVTVTREVDSIVKLCLTHKSHERPNAKDIISHAWFKPSEVKKIGRFTVTKQ